MKNRTRENCTSGSVRDEAGQPPHLLGRRQFLPLVAGAAALPAFSSMVRAQAYPARPITMVVPYAAGGAIDTTGRILAEAMRGPIGQPVIVENVAGASGSIGVGRVARASPDGYTFVIGNWATHVLNGAMFTLQYDPQKDFEPISLVSNNPLIIVAKNAVPANDLQEFVAWLKANPGQATQGTTGAGGLSTVVGLFFQKETRTRFRFVPYRGGLGPAMQDLVAGQIDFMIDNPANALPQVRAGMIKAYAVTSKRPADRGVRYPDGRRGGSTRPLRIELAGDISAESDAQGHSGQGERRCRGRFGRSDRGTSACRSRPGDFPAVQAVQGGVIEKRGGFVATWTTQ
jgi:tripartite-type tricarboxylate transporter receptor subunit TctC